MEKNIVRNIEKENMPKKVIIDFIRHGESEYKEYFNKNISEQLDLTKEGILNIENTAKQLEEMIDKKNEVVLLVESPNKRAQDSLQIIKKYLEEKGFSILNKDNIYESKQIRALDPKDPKEYMTHAKKYYDSDKSKNKRFGVIKEEIAKSMNKDFGEVFSEDSFEKVENRFNRFIRHMSNINEYLSEDTKEKIGNRTIRIICLSHEELPAELLNQNFDDEKILNGQILEIKPKDIITE